MNFDESETKKNLLTALQGEALAHLKYQFYKSQISNYSKEYEQLLDEIVHNEKEHAKIWFKQLHNGMPSDMDNLLDAYEGELYEHTKMYPLFSKVAEEEGFDEISKLFYQIGLIEGYHMEQFQDMREHLSDIHSSDDDGTVWKCLNCGYKVKGKDAPIECPVCKHSRKYFIKNSD